MLTWRGFADTVTFDSVFLRVTLVLPYSKKTFLAWTECSNVKRWLTKYAWLFQLIGGLQQLFCQCFTNECCQKYASAGRGIESQMPYVSQQSCLLGYGDHYIPCFLIVPPCTGLRWCPDVVLISLIYLSIHISTVKHPKQNKWFDK